MDRRALTSQLTAPSQLAWPSVMSRSLDIRGSISPNEKVMPMIVASMARKAPITTQP